MVLNLNELKPFNIITDVNFNLLNNTYRGYFKFLFNIINEVNTELPKGRILYFKLDNNNFKYSLIFSKKHYTKKGELFVDKIWAKLNSLNDDIEEELQFRYFLTELIFE
jgi:hypothetical protein